LSYIGGKAKIGKWIKDYIPKDIKTYCEPFGGMFWVFFNMNLSQYPKLENVIYNDFNKLNTNLFKCVREYDKLWEILSEEEVQQRNVLETPQKLKDKFYLYQKEIFSKEFELSEEEKFYIAKKYLYVLTQIFSGSKPEKSRFIDYKGKYKCKYLTFMDKLKNEKYRLHFDRITEVENLDFEDVIKKYDSPYSYFYLDPPYYKTEKYYSNHDFDSNDHYRLAKLLKNISGRFSLSYYHFDLLDE
jgi:DNA adenine methylase